MSGIGFFLTAKIALMDFLRPDLLLFEKVAKVRQENGFLVKAVSYQLPVMIMTTRVRKAWIRLERDALSPPKNELGLNF